MSRQHSAGGCIPRTQTKSLLYPCSLPASRPETCGCARSQRSLARLSIRRHPDSPHGPFVLIHVAERPRRACRNWRSYPRTRAQSESLHRRTPNGLPFSVYSILQTSECDKTRRMGREFDLRRRRHRANAFCQGQVFPWLKRWSLLQPPWSAAVTTGVTIGVTMGVTIVPALFVDPRIELVC